MCPLEGGNKTSLIPTYGYCLSLSQPSKNRLFPVFGDEDDMVKTMPSDVGLLFPVFHRLSPSQTIRWSDGLSLFQPFWQPRIGQTFSGHTAKGGGLTDL